MADRQHKYFTVDELQPFDPHSPSDQAAEAEKRAMCDHFIRRLKKRDRHGLSEEEAISAIVGGGMTAICGLFIALAGENLDDDAPDKLHAILDFCWLQALSHGMSGRVQ